MYNFQYCELGNLKNVDFDDWRSYIRPVLSIRHGSTKLGYLDNNRLDRNMKRHVFVGDKMWSVKSSLKVLVILKLILISLLFSVSVQQHNYQQYQGQGGGPANGLLHQQQQHIHAIQSQQQQQQQQPRQPIYNSQPPGIRMPGPTQGQMPEYFFP